MTKDLSEAEAFEVIKEGRIGRLGCIDQNEPYVIPINYVVEQRTIYSHSLPGKKIDAMRANPKVCLQVDHIEDDFHWRSAIALGNFEEIKNPNERETILSKLLYRFPRLTPVESRIAEDVAAPDSIAFRITIDRVTGVAED